METKTRLAIAIYMPHNDSIWQNHIEFGVDHCDTICFKRVTTMINNFNFENTIDIGQTQTYLLIITIKLRLWNSQSTQNLSRLSLRSLLQALVSHATKKQLNNTVSCIKFTQIVKNVNYHEQFSRNKTCLLYFFLIVKFFRFNALIEFVL